MPVFIENSASFIDDSISDLTAFLEVKTTEKKPIIIATNNRMLTISISRILRLILNNILIQRNKKSPNIRAFFDLCENYLKVYPTVIQAA